MELNKFGKRAYECALKRGKIHAQTDPYLLHEETVEGIMEEVREIIEASETTSSEHLDHYPAVVEELADVAIASLTELHRRGVDIEEVLLKKMEYNEQR